MDLLLQWRRRLYGAAAGAVIAPVAIFVAVLVVGFGGGGLDGLGALRQAISGPELPRAQTLARSPRRDDPGRLLARVRRQADAAAGAGATAGGGAGTAGAGTGGAPGGGPGGATPVATVAPGGGTVPGGGGPDPTPPTEPEPPAPTPGPDGPIRGVADQVTQITDQVPIAGQPVGDVVDGLVDVLEPRP